MLNKIVIATLFIVMSVTVHGQVDYNRQYSNAKDLFVKGKFNLAMEAFKPLIAYDKDNKYAQYASFYYALAAYKQGYKAVAKDMLNQIRTTHANWDKLNEVYFWLGRIHFENGDYFQGLKVFKNISDKHFEKDINSTKQNFLVKITDVETLRMMHEEYPKDEIIAKTFATALSKDTSSDQDKEQLEKLIDNFKLTRSDFFPEVPKTFLKDEYNVAVMLPFMVNALEPTPSRKRNQIILDFYEGMKLAVDTLNLTGAKINLRIYDTEQSNSDRVEKLFETNELKLVDLIVGPLFPAENEIAQKFSLANKINIVHPFSNNSELIGNNPHAYLFQPSSETIGTKAAEFLADRTRRKNTMVFYGPTQEDSVLAANFVKQAAEKGLTVVLNQRIAAGESKKILEILATPTEFDEFKYPSEFSLKKDSVGSIYVASDDPLIYSEVVGSVETRGDSIRVVGSENWIDDTAINPEKYQTLGMALTAPNFADPSKPEYKRFFQLFVKSYGRTPTAIAKMGFEFMMLFGTQLKNNGVYFQDELAKQGTLPGYLTEGFNFESARNNQLIPFITFQKGQVVLLDKR